MNQNLQNILDLIQQSSQLSEDDKTSMIKAIKKVDHELTIVEFKLDRTEKVKRTTSILLEETIAELEQKRKEAIKQTSLDRIRGQIASMRSTEDLQRITPIIWHELTVLGVPFIRCGVFIIDEQKQMVQVYLSAPDGHSLAAMNLPFESNDLTSNSVKSWRKGAVYKEQWNKEQFVNWMQSLIDQGYIQDTQTYQGASQPPESLYLHFVPFTQGMLYVGNVQTISAEKLDLVKALAETFSIAYARYEDFNNLDKAKQSIESTLTELKATQSQLIQSEKMASLGELTAGIAHEIQNPLNFVNNFSEVSSELVQEAQEEIEKGELKEAAEILSDLIQNLEKITHHGQRASSIVKGMLDHSRSSSGEKELVDINALCDEYLRLAYHGMRAKDKSFNAKFETDFDERLPKMNIIPQDIGRVVLNIINNAFQAISLKPTQDLTGFDSKQDQAKMHSNKSPNQQKQNANLSGFTPNESTNKQSIGLVKVSTSQMNNHIQITITDNGPGIPDNIKDKIFQPFFTTKPTGQGTGLGLSLSYDIVKAHGGELKVKTQEGEGTEMIIILPTTNEEIVN